MFRLVVLDKMRDAIDPFVMEERVCLRVVIAVDWTSFLMGGFGWMEKDSIDGGDVTNTTTNKSKDRKLDSMLHDVASAYDGSSVMCDCDR